MMELIVRNVRNVGKSRTCCLRHVFFNLLDRARKSVIIKSCHGKAFRTAGHFYGKFTSNLLIFLHMSMNSVTRILNRNLIWYDQTPSHENVSTNAKCREITLIFATSHHMYQGQGQVITCHSLQWDVITCPCPQWQFPACKFSFT